jgi:curved DNA-binding protein CbpA
MDDTDDTRAKIQEQYEFIQDADYYEILGVDESAGKSEITSRFRELAKEWHADRFPDDQLEGDDRQKVQEIFAEINNAYQTLSNPQDRDEYDAALETEDTDIGSVIDAEDNFRKGRNLLDAGRYEGAHEKFEAACELSPEDEPEYRAHRLYTEYLLLLKHQDGTPRDRDEAGEIFDEMDDISRNMNDEKDWLYAFMGRVADGLDRMQQAQQLFQEARRINPNNRMAERQLRLIKRRREKEQEDEGLLQNLLSKLNLT